MKEISNLSKKERHFFYPSLVERDGEYCQLCGKTKDEIGLLEIHEIKYERPIKILNLKLLCHGCNHNELLRKERIEIIEKSAEHKKNSEKEPLYDKWLYGKLLDNNWHYLLDEAIDSGAYVCEISTETVKRYLRKLTSEAGPYTTKASQYGEMHLWLKGKEPLEQDFF